METTRFETEAEATRERIASTVDDLQERLNPKTVMNDAVEAIQDTSAAIIDSISRLVRENPVVLAGAGLAGGLVAIIRTRIIRRHRYEDSYGYIGDDREGGTWDSAKSQLADTADRARDYASDTASRAGSTIYQNPLAAAVVGFSTGALFGLALPRTEVEDRYFGPASDTVTAAAKSVGMAAVEASKRELDELGLNREGAKAKIADLSEQVGDAAAHVGHAAAEAAKREVGATGS